MGITTVSNKYAITLEPNNNTLKTVLNVAHNNNNKIYTGKLNQNGIGVLCTSILIRI